MGKHDKQRMLKGALALIAALAMAAPLFAQTSGGVTGFAKDPSGKPYVGYTILIKRQDVNETYKTKTNKHGRYVYIGLPIGVYKVTLISPDGKPVFYISKNVGMGDPTEIDFDMAKEEQRAKEEEAKNPVVQQAQQQQAKEQKKFVSLSVIYNQGTALYNKQDYAGAAAQFEKALPLASGKNELVVLTRLADSYDKAKDYKNAIATYQKAIQLAPTEADLYNNLGSVYSDMGDIKSAELQYEKAAQTDPTHAAMYYYNMGVTFVNENQPDAALNAFQKAIKADPTYAEAYFQEGQTLLSKASTSPSGKTVFPPGTAEAYQTYLKLAPTGPNAATAKAILQTLQAGVQTQYKAKRR